MAKFHNEVSLLTPACKCSKQNFEDVMNFLSVHCALLIKALWSEAFISGGEPVTFTCSEFMTDGGLCVSPNGGSCP